MQAELKNKIWWSYLEDDLQELMLTAALLVEKVENWDQKFHDYSFVVFPASKGYEGFLKKLFLDMGFITEKDYYGKRFRIGKALNPSLSPKYRKKESVYDRIVDYCGGEELAKKLWDTWKNCRNLLFHWFPKEKKAIDFPEAKQRVNQVFDSIDAAFEECKVSYDNRKKIKDDKKG